MHNAYLKRTCGPPRPKALQLRDQGVQRQHSATSLCRLCPLKRFADPRSHLPIRRRNPCRTPYAGARGHRGSSEHCHSRQARLASLCFAYVRAASWTRYQNDMNHDASRNVPQISAPNVPNELKRCLKLFWSIEHGYTCPSARCNATSGANSSRQAVSAPVVSLQGDFARVAARGASAGEQNGCRGMPTIVAHPTLQSIVRLMSRRNPAELAIETLSFATEPRGCRRVSLSVPSLHGSRYWLPFCPRILSSQRC